MPNQGNCPSFCPPSWSSLPQMKTPRQNLALVCLPSGGGLVAIGGLDYNYLDVVEGLLGDSANNWRPLAPLPTPLRLRGAVLFRQRILVAGGTTTGGNETSNMFAFNPPTLGGSGQWTRLKPKLPKPAYPVCAVAWGKEVFLVGKPLRVSRLASVWMLMDRFLSLDWETPVEVFKFSETDSAAEDEVVYCSFFCSSVLCLFILTTFAFFYIDGR